jgi:hypothetical protein
VDSNHKKEGGAQIQTKIKEGEERSEKARVTVARLPAGLKVKNDLCVN